MRARVASKEYGETRRVDQQQSKIQIKKEDNERVRGNPLRGLPERLEEFTENLVDTRVPVHGDAPTSSSCESASACISFRAAEKSGIG